MHPAVPYCGVRAPARAILAVVLVAALPRPAAAVVILTASGTGNTTAPTDDPGFANVGYSTSGYGTAIYVGGGWVLTCNHVAGDGIVLASGTYRQASGPGTNFSLVNTTPGRAPLTDLYMFKLETEPVGLPTLSIATTMSGTGDAVVMIGGGLDRGAFTQWTVNQATDPWTWTVTASAGDAVGFGTLGTQAIRWGTNNVEANDFWVKEAYNTGPADYWEIKSLATTFDDGVLATEAQAVLHDSGGAVFTKTGGQWRLAGVIYSVLGYSGQPNPIYNAIIGDATLIADLSYYGPQITAVVPEPSGAGMVAAAVVLLAVRRRHRPARVAAPTA